MRNGDVEEMMKLSTARSRHTVRCHGLYTLNLSTLRQHYLFDALVLFSVRFGNMILSLKEKVQGELQSSFSPSMHGTYNIRSVP